MKHHSYTMFNSLTSAFSELTDCLWCPYIGCVWTDLYFKYGKYINVSQNYIGRWIQ